MSGKEQKKSLFLKLFIGSFFCLLVGLAYLLFFSPVFRFQQISVDLDKLNQPLVEQARDLVDSRLQANNWWQLPTKSFFAFNAGQLKQDLQAQFPELGEIKIYKRLFWPQGFKWQPGLYVEISLRQKQVLYCQAGTILEPDNFNYDLDVGQCYWLDEQGIIFAKTPLIKGGSVILAYDIRQSEPALGQLIVEPELVDFMMKSLPAMAEFASLDYFLIGVLDVPDLIFKTKKSWQIHFDTSQDFSSQISAVKTVLEQEIPADVRESRLQYIDVRIPGRVYYR